MRLVLLLTIVLAGSSLASAQEREWTFDTGEQDAFLVFGVPETDDTGLSFWCAIGSGQISIFISEAGAALQPESAVHVDIVVAEQTFGFDGRVHVNEESRIPSAEAKVDAKDTLFGLLQAADRFKVKVADREDIYPLEGADFPSLLRTCGKP